MSTSHALRRAVRVAVRSGLTNVLSCAHAARGQIQFRNASRLSAHAPRFVRGGPAWWTKSLPASIVQSLGKTSLDPLDRSPASAVLSAPMHVASGRNSRQFFRLDRSPDIKAVSHRRGPFRPQRPVPLEIPTVTDLVRQEIMTAADTVVVTGIRGTAAARGRESARREFWLTALVVVAVFEELAVGIILPTLSVSAGSRVSWPGLRRPARRSTRRTRRATTISSRSATPGRPCTASSPRS